jgi:hypothetical protein
VANAVAEVVEVAFDNAGDVAVELRALRAAVSPIRVADRASV